MFNELDTNSRKALLDKKMSLQGKDTANFAGLWDSIKSSVGSTKSTCGEAPLLSAFRTEDEFNVAVSEYEQCRQKAIADGQSSTSEAIEEGKGIFNFTKGLWNTMGTGGGGLSYEGQDITLLDPDSEEAKNKCVRSNMIISAVVVVAIVVGFIVYKKYKK